MSDSGESPSSSPPADTAPPPKTSSGNSTPPPADESPPTPPADSSPPPPSEPSPPPPDSQLPPLPSILPPITANPPPASESPPSSDSQTPSPPPPTSTNSPSPPSPTDSETPPAPPNESNNNSPPSSPNVQSPPPSSSSPKKLESPPSPPTPPSDPTNSPPTPPSDPTNSPPSPPLDSNNSPPIQPLGPVNSPPGNPNAPPSPFNTAPPKTASSGPVVSPSLTVPSKGTTPSSNQSNGYQGKTVVGMAVAGFAIMALIAVVFLVRRKKKKNIDSYGHSQYLPHPNFSVKSDGFLYGQDPNKGYSSGPGGSMYNSQQQQHSAMGNSFGSQTGYPHHQMQSSGAFDSAILGTGQTNFSYEELANITQGFAHHNILGEGGFGCVYKGTLQDGKVVAVKQLKAGSGQGDREFKAEVEIISRVHHRHLVSLVGYCISDPHRLLIYEFVSNQTLEHHLHEKGLPVLEWSKRVRIAIGSAKGLAYLHEDCHPKIIHRDIKSANILLDDEYEAQVADFGLARLNDTTQTHVSTRVMGTFGYLAPEYASSGKLTDRSDVFSFGVVLLELVTGRKPVDQSQPLGEESLVEWARPLLVKAIETGDFSELIDRRLEKRYVEHEVFRMIETAAACVRHSGPKRPRMVQVVRALDCDEDSGDISNGIKVGQSTTYDSGQYNQDIMKFRKMAFGFDNNSETGIYSGDYSVKSSSDFSGNESETRPFNNRRF
ncbi:Proline-rich receptor-like protein kinase PERK12 [Cardamine amara subsp. amara]|uniref:non-specific serine/threonine protein kinase n=1 Tax=Cardamine amara subsp. amara TaxID=228776 RepID=A0ABD1C0J5_CARAN